jgi:hypothetical protein
VQSGYLSFIFSCNIFFGTYSKRRLAATSPLPEGSKLSLTALKETRGEYLSKRNALSAEETWLLAGLIMKVV